MDGALILAGGRSSRMGRDKAWLELDGRAGTLLEHVLTQVAARCSPIVLSARPGQALPPVDIDQLERVDDPIPDPSTPGGPLIGVIAGLERLAARDVALAYLGSCDAAALTSEHVAFMLDHLANQPSAIMVVARDGDYLHPLASAVRVPELLAHARDLQARGVHRLQALAEHPQALHIDATALPDPRVLAPCNTPEQWRALTRAER